MAITLNATDHPGGTRFIYSDHWLEAGNARGATIVEWSPRGWVKLRYENGQERWHGPETVGFPLALDILSSPPEAL